MATKAWSTISRHNNDEQFRAWGRELSEKFKEVGLVQTADTGQIDWATATRPGTNSFAGDEFYRFDDSLQGSAPVFLRIRYGTAGNSNVGALYVAVGTGTSGSGALTGLIITPGGVFDSYIAGTLQSFGQPRISLLSHSEGFLGLSWKYDIPANRPDGSFFVVRSTGFSGELTGNFVTLIHQGTATSRTLSYSQNKVMSEGGSSNGKMMISPSNENNTRFGTNFVQALVPFVTAPKMSPLFAVCGVRSTEVNTFSTFRSKIVGESERTYIALPDRNGSTNWAIDGTGSTFISLYKPAMIWE